MRIPFIPNDILNKDFSMLFFQNLTPTRRFAQNFTPKSDRILEKKVPYFLEMAVLIPLTGSLSSPFNQKTKLNKYKEKTKQNR